MQSDIFIFSTLCFVNVIIFLRTPTGGNNIKRTYDPMFFPPRGDLFVKYSHVVLFKLHNIGREIDTAPSCTDYFLNKYYETGEVIIVLFPENESCLFQSIGGGCGYFEVR